MGHGVEPHTRLAVREDWVKIAFLEPHLRVAGAVRRVIELGNELVRLGHQVTYLIPSSEPLRCDWMTCLGRVAQIEPSFHEPFDVLVFNDETQWSLVDLFKRATLTVYYLLGYGALYDKPGSRESYRYPVDLRIENSGWVAECIEQEIGIRPVVVTPGIDLDLFRPVKTPKVYDVLTYGSARASKGTKEVEEACRRLGVRLEKYEGKNLPQSKLAEEYCRARVFAVGSYFEGFGQPGLEALACGILLRARPRSAGTPATAAGKPEEKKPRQIVARYPNHVWSADRTRLWRWGVWATWALVAIDHFSRKVVASCPLEGPNAGWVVGALATAFHRHGPPCAC